MNRMCGKNRDWIVVAVVLLMGMAVPMTWGAPRGQIDPFAGEADPIPAATQADSLLHAPPYQAVETPTVPPEVMPAPVPVIASHSIKNFGPIIERVQFKDNDISLIFQVVSDATGWSIFPGPKVTGKITLYARGITAGDLLDTAVRMAGFIYVKQGEIISVMTYEDYMLYYGVVKRTFSLEYRDAGQVASVLTPFVTTRGRLIPDAGSRSLVIYEVPTNLPLLEEILRKIDMPADSKVVRVIKLIHADADALADHMLNVFGGEQKQATGEAAFTRAAVPPASQPARPAADMLWSADQSVSIQPVARTNHLILRGYPADLDRIKELIADLDIPGDLETRHYQVIHLLAGDVLDSLQQSLGVYGSTGNTRGGGTGRNRSGMRGRSQTGGAGPQMGGDLGMGERVRLSYLEESNAIVVTASAHIHRQVAEFLRMCDVPPFQVAGGIRSYKLQNAAAPDVARILLELINQPEQGNGSEFKLGSMDRGPAVTGPSASTPPPAPPVTGAPGSVAAASAGVVAGDGGLIGVASERRAEKPRISFSEPTNTVIIQATVQEHAQFTQVIKELDRQLPQVLIEVIMVELRHFDDIDVGVELENFGRPGDSIGRLLFTSFGLSTINPATGQRTLNVAPGGTAVITRTEDVPAIIHALQSKGKAKLRSAPRVLVNDNAVGLIQSIAEEPYSQVNASTTVATTSFGGFVQAGTQLRMIPHISNDDYLRLEYEITLNSFRGASGNPNLPPARDTSTVTSQATIPDGGTLIVAGLSYYSDRDTTDSLPFIADIPVLNLIFGRNITRSQETRLYVFVRPTILRDSQFRQLKQISDRDRREACEPLLEPVNPMLDLHEVLPS